MLYDEEFINSLPDPAMGWKSPIVVYIAKEVSRPHAELKRYLENWYKKIPEAKRLSYYSRLRSSDDKEFCAQIFEFLVSDFCARYGEVDFDPILVDGKTPELLWEIEGAKGLLDVVTLFEDKEKGDQQKGLNSLLNYLSSVEHYYTIGISYEYVNLQELKYSVIKKQLIRYLDTLDYNNIGVEEQLVIDNYGICVTFTPITREIKEKKPISFAVMSPCEEVEPLKSISKRIRSKLNKYKWEGPIFVAICKQADFGVDWEEVASVLYGQIKVMYCRDLKKNTEELDSTGIVMPKGKNPPNNTSLTGVLHCELVWTEGLPELKVKYLMNPFSKYPVKLKIPSYPRAEKGKVIFEWINSDENQCHY